MKSYREELWFNIHQRRAFINITDLVNKALKKSNVQEGLVLVNTGNNYFLKESIR